MTLHCSPDPCAARLARSRPRLFLAVAIGWPLAAAETKKRRRRPCRRRRPRRSSSRGWPGARSAPIAAAASRPWRAWPAQPQVYYLGATGGGVWKTTNGGASWNAVSDGQVKTGSVGAIAVAPSDPNVVYAGMGESCIRGNVSHGDGVYRSTDARQDLDARRPARHAADRPRPRPPAATPTSSTSRRSATPSGPNAERGVFRSNDGGKTWEKVLFVRRQDRRRRPGDGPGQPARALRRLLAGAAHALEPRQRRPRQRALQDRPTAATPGRSSTRKPACRKGPLGRIGVSVSPARPGPRLRRDRGRGGRRLPLRRRAARPGSGRTRTASSASAPGTTRTSTPTRRSPTRVYVLNVQFFRSNDGGKTFQHDPRAARRQPRPVDRSRRPAAHDRGQRRRRATSASTAARPGRRIDNQPTAQFYHVITDDQFPYRVYGAQQDNSTVAIASRTDGGGIGARDWYAGRRRRERLHRAEAGRPRHRLRRLLRRLHRPRYDRRTGQERDDHRLARQPDGLGRRGHEVPLPVDLPDRLLAATTRTCSTPARQRALPHHATRARAGRRSGPT